MTRICPPSDPCPGPDRHPKRPNFAAPRGACDCHVHGSALRLNSPFSPQRSYTPEDCTFEDLERLHATLGIDRAVIVHGGAHGTDNRRRRWRRSTAIPTGCVVWPLFRPACRTATSRT